MPFDERTEALASGRRQVLNAAGSGSPVVWLHGLGGVEPDDPLLAALAREHRVIAPLAPGVRDLEELEGLAPFHMVAWDRPIETVTAVRDFIAKTERSLPGPPA